jgi:hypothetical protein
MCANRGVIFRRRGKAAVYPLIVLALGAVLLGWKVPEIGPAFRAAAGSGTPGTFTLEQQRCSKGGCKWSGSYVSTDGRVVRHDVLFAGDLPEKFEIGRQVSAKNTGSPTYVYSPGGAQAENRSLAVALFIGLAFVFVGVSGFWPSPGDGGRMRNETGD